jgi:hypothetical protein
MAVRCHRRQAPPTPRVCVARRLCRYEAARGGLRVIPGQPPGQIVSTPSYQGRVATLLTPAPMAVQRVGFGILELLRQGVLPTPDPRAYSVFAVGGLPASRPCCRMRAVNRASIACRSALSFISAHRELISRASWGEI